MVNLNSIPARRNRTRVTATCKRFLTSGSVICTIALAIVWASVWYETDRPLREIELKLKANQTSDAFRQLTQFLKNHPQDSRALAIKARMLVDMGNLSEAIHLFERVGAANPTDLHAWAKALLLRREWSSAFLILERIIQLDPDDADALHEIAACQSYLGHLTEALDSAKRLSQLKGQQPRAYFQIGALYEIAGSKKLAADAWEKVLEFSPAADDLQVSAAEFFLAYGSVLLDLGRISTATTVLRKSLELQESAECRLRLGNAMLNADNLPSAIESWKRAIELSPNLREAREALAEAALRYRHFDEARNWLAPVLRTSDVTSASAHLMQRICLASGDIAASHEWRARSLELHQREHLALLINQKLTQAPNSGWSRAIRAFRFAESGNWTEAARLANTLADESIADEPFVRQLSQAVRVQGTLPSLSLIPVQHF